jgi:hypothetical protein
MHGEVFTGCCSAREQTIHKKKRQQISSDFGYHAKLCFCTYSTCLEYTCLPVLIGLWRLIKHDFGTAEDGTNLKLAYGV